MSPLFLRRKAAVKLPLKLAFISVVFCATLFFSRFSERKHDASVRVDSGNEGFISRHVLAIPYKERPLIVGENGTVINETLAGNGTENKHECTPPAYHEFPPDAFTPKQRAQGAIILHTILVVYMFYALAIVCDEYFVSSLDKICERLGLSEDVAGATFMAAGSSAPELFTSIIGVFIAKGDVGVGTIVGSAVFNILFVIGLCGILAGQVVHLNWFPLLRDSLFYSLSVIALILSIFDGNVSWYESLIMLLLYAIYIVIMRFNPQIQAYAEARFGKQEEDASIMPGPGKVYGQNYEKFQNEENGQIPNGAVVLKADEYFARPSRKLSFEDACFKIMITRLFRPITRFRAAARILMIERKRLLRDPAFMKRQKWRTYSVDGSMPSYTKAIRNCLSIAEDPEANDIFQLPSLKSGPLFIVRWVVAIPIKSLLYFTVPDCRKDRWARWYLVTFGMSIVWIAAFSYVMVWMVALMGFTMGIPDSIMGISFLAAGTSIPDAMASVIVARQGMGDMAVSNTIGSNVFDILMGLAFPWFIKTAIVSPGLTVHINSNGMIFSVLLLFLTVMVTIGVIHFTGWQLNQRLGMIFLSVYAVFLTFSICIEFNVFGYVNPPMCTEYD